MADTLGDFLLRRLAQWGVRRIYGSLSNGVNGLIGALGRGRSGIDFVPVQHEELAALMACAHARFSGQVGVCVATSGAGAIHLMSGLLHARLGRQPLLAIVAEQRVIDLPVLFKQVAEECLQITATTPEQALQQIDRAMRIARGGRSVGCLVLPSAVQDWSAAAMPPPEVGSASALVPAEAELDRAAAVLNAGRQVAMLAGAGALQASAEIIAVADRLGAGVAKTLAGKAAVPDDLPHVTGAIGGRPSDDLMARCDTLLVVGSSLPDAEFLPADGQARGVRIDIEPRSRPLGYAMEVELVGDSRATLAALLPLLERKEERGFRERIEADVARWWQLLDARAMDEAEPINPQRVFRELSPRLPEHCIVTCDAGSCATWFARNVKLRRGMSAALLDGLAAIGSAVPYAIAAKYAQPGRPVLALLGDGAMQMNGLNGLLIVAQVWREWANPRLTIMVLNDGEPSEATSETRDAELGFDTSPSLPEFPYAAYADLIGLRGIRVDHAEAVAPAWAAALGSDVPTLLEMVTDPRVSPWPARRAATRSRAA